MKKRTQGIIGLVAIIVFVVATISWNLFFKEKLTYINVVVPLKPLYQGDVVTMDKLREQPTDRKSVLAGSISLQAVTSIIGKEARSYIPAGAQLVAEYFDDPGTVLEDGQFFFAIPKEWIIAMPDSIRRKDMAFIYVISTSDSQRLFRLAQPTASVSPVQTPAASETAKADSLGISNTPTPSPSAEQVIATVDILNDIVAGKEYEMACRVAYVKDSSNREVITVAPENGKIIDRLDGSSQISRIEVIATMEQIDTLQKAVAKGYKFLILYK